jgi:hypothetical protein
LVIRDNQPRIDTALMKNSRNSCLSIGQMFSVR